MGLVATSALEPSIESVLEPSILVRAAGMVRRTLAFVVDLGFLLPLQVLFFCGLRLGQRLPLPRLKELYPDVLLANLSDGSLSSQALCISFVAVLVAYFVFFHTYPATNLTIFLAPPLHSTSQIIPYPILCS